MERYVLYCQGAARGELTLLPQGACTQVEARMPDPGDGVYRAALVGERGTLKLGVLEPSAGELCLRRRPYSRDVAAIGPILRGEAACSVPFGGAWERVERPAALLRDPFLSRRLADVPSGWRRQGEVLELALPLERGRPFPLETLFCLARVETVEGTDCAVYRFDREGKPLPPERKMEKKRK